MRASRSTVVTVLSRERISVALLLVYFIVLVRTAWLSDDAYITFRYAYNVVNGHGLTWNPGHRVQAFSNPLWTGLISVAYFLTREIYFTSLALSILFSLGAMGVLWTIATSRVRFWLGAGILILSKAFVDYSTSGLEDPLLHFLLAVFAYVFLAESRPRKRLLNVSTVGALLMMTRMDAVLLVAPAVLLTAGDVIDRDHLAASGRVVACTLAIGGLPFLVWKAFELVYYGYPVPNTYFAKTNTTDTWFELVQQGYHFLTYSFAQDVVLLVGLVAAIPLAIRSSDRRLGGLAVGIGLYLGYLFAIGGGFMAGRLLSEPLLVSVIILVRTVDFSAEQAKTGLLLLLVVSVGLPTSPVYLQTLQSGEDYGGATVNEHGMIDERGFYYQGTGLIAEKDRKNTYLAAEQGREWSQSDREVYVAGTVGMRGYYAGPDVHIIDYNALTDPLLAQLEGDGRVGHYERGLPAGYLWTVQTGENHIESEGVRRFYEKVVVITTGELWSVDRLKTIVRMNMGAYNHLLRSPLRWTFPLQRVNDPVGNGTRWNAPHVIAFERRITVTMEELANSIAVELSTDRNDRYRVEFLNDDRVVGTVTLSPSNATGSGLVTRRVIVPSEAVQAGFTRIRITAEAGDGKFSVGHVRLLNDTATDRHSLVASRVGER